MDLGLSGYCILFSFLLFVSLFFQIWLLSKSLEIDNFIYIPIPFYLAAVLLRTTISRFFSVGCHALISDHRPFA
jgi:hypothetical protein